MYIYIFSLLFQNLIDGRIVLFTKLYADACGEVTGHAAGHQEVGMCSTRDGSWGMYITFAFAKKKANKAEPTLALKPRGDVTRNPKQGYLWPPKRDKNFKKKNNPKTN